MQAVQAARTNLASLKVQENSATKKKYDSMAKTVHKLPADVKESIDAAAAIFGANQVEPKSKAPKKRKWFNGAWSFFVKSYQQFFGWQSSPAGQSTNRNAGLGAPPPIPPPSLPPGARGVHLNSLPRQHYPNSPTHYPNSPAQPGASLIANSPLALQPASTRSAPTRSPPCSTRISSRPGRRRRRLSSLLTCAPSTTTSFSPPQSLTSCASTSSPG